MKDLGTAYAAGGGRGDELTFVGKNVLCFD